MPPKDTIWTIKYFTKSVDIKLNKYYNNERLFTKGFVMGISSLGVGSGILTQDVLDQLRQADESQRITPITLNLANENDKSNAIDILDASMVNFRDAANELQSATLFDARATTVTGTSVSVTAAEGSDVQDFTLNVTQLARKEIDESASFGADTALIATGTGTLDLTIGTTSYTIDYDATTTLKDLKNSINAVAGQDVSASVVQLATGDFRLFLNAANEGTSQNISITDTSGFLSDDGGTTAGGTNLTTGMSTIQTGLDATFEYNGQAITRSTNNVTDLISGYTISLDELGSSSVSIEHDRSDLESRVDSFVTQYNSIMTEISKQTKPSTDSKVRGIFSGDSIIKSMKTSIQNMLDSISNAGGNLQDYGFDIDRDGVMSVDKTVLNEKLDENPGNVKAFFAGGDYTDSTGTVTTLTGAFSSFYTTVNSFTKTNGGLDQVKTNINENISSYEDRKTRETERLDSKYEILKKQYTAYNALINRFNSSSDIFTQLANANNN